MTRDDRDQKWNLKVYPKPFVNLSTSDLFHLKAREMYSIDKQEMIMAVRKQLLIDDYLEIVISFMISKLSSEISSVTMYLIT